jgi:hypothetical protein
MMESWHLNADYPFLPNSQSLPNFSSNFYADGLTHAPPDLIDTEDDEYLPLNPSPSKKRRTTIKSADKKTHGTSRDHGRRRRSPTCLPVSPLTTRVKGLRFFSLEEANDHANDRVTLALDPNVKDDLMNVKRDAHRHVMNLVQAFTTQVIDEPSEHHLDQIALTAWHQFQSNHVEKCKRYAGNETDIIEICAWKVYGIVMDIHQNGLPKLNNIPLDRKSKCSERLELITSSIANYAIVRYDVLRLVKLNELAASPYNYVSRKITNWKNNEHKARRDQENADAAARTGTVYRKVLGDHSRSTPAKKIIVKRESPPVTPPRLIKVEASCSSQDEPRTPFAQSESYFIVLTCPYHSLTATHLQLHKPQTPTSSAPLSMKRPAISTSPAV